jgi:Xaa-Pro dipeptidase
MSAVEIESLLEKIDALKAENEQLENQLVQGEEASEESFFSMGLDTQRVPMRMHSENRARLVKAMHAAGHTRGVILMQGGSTKCQYDTDTELVFRQESYFNFLFGVKEPEWFGVIDLKDGTTTLFMSRLPEESVVWMGAIKDADYFHECYETDAVCYVDEMHGWLCKRMGVKSETTTCLNSEPIFVLYGRNSDSGSFTVTTADYEHFNIFKIVDKATLHPIIANTRVLKSDLELELMQYVSYVTSMAHVEVMRNVRAGMSEYQLESLFRHHIYTYGGCRHVAYTCICACG